MRAFVVPTIALLFIGSVSAPTRELPNGAPITFSNDHNPGAIDRLPDDYIEGKPYWAPVPAKASAQPAAVATPERKPEATMAADAPIYSPPPQDPGRLPDDYIDGKPYWAPTPVTMNRLPSGVVVYSPWESDFGGRYWFSSGKTQLDLFASPVGLASDRVSRLAYKGLIGNSGEVFGRIEHATGFFAKGYAGLGTINSGTLQDEDFPQLFDSFVYSSTNSDQRGGSLAYGTIDLGWAWRLQNFKLGFFAGYFHYSETLHAFGCTQTATNSSICPPGAVAASTEVIRQETSWDAARLGINTEWNIGSGFKLNTDLAWLPYVNLNAKDSHLLRIGTCFDCFNGPTPLDGSDAITSVQIEAILSYNFADAFSVGLGGRYWSIKNQQSGSAHFEISGSNPLSFPQAISFRTERWGAFLQGSYKFGQLQPSVL